MTQIASLGAADTFATRRTRINEGFVKIQNNESTTASVGVSSASWANANDTISFTRPDSSVLDLTITGFGSPSDATIQAQAALANTNSQITTLTSAVNANNIAQKVLIDTKISNTVITTISTRDIIPSANDTYSLGSLAMQWKDVFVGPGSLYINGTKVLEDDSGTITVSADTDQAITIKTLGTGVTTVQSAAGVAVTGTGSGDVTLTTTSGNIELKGTVQLLSGKRITDSAGTAVQFGDDLDMNNNKITELGTPSANADAATKLYVDTSIADLANSAPTTLNTLNELAAALGDDADFAATTATALGLKATEANSLLRLSNTNTQIATKLATSSYTTADVQAKAALANTNSRIAAIVPGLASANVVVTSSASTITTTQDDVALNDEALVNPDGLLSINLGGTVYKIPYFS
tara:strand:+ start:105 stop:1334 length:1230 start_codon:yes stop_codon:yes gene_type:complete